MIVTKGGRYSIGIVLGGEANIGKSQNGPILGRQYNTNTVSPSLVLDSSFWNLRERRLKESRAPHLCPNAEGRKVQTRRRTRWGGVERERSLGRSGIKGWGQRWR